MRSRKEECPCCMGKGFVKFERIILRNKIFKREDYIEDCPLCLSWGHVNIIDNDYREADHRKWYIHTGGSTFVEEFKGDRISLFEEGGNL